jgi:23S rRNA pseudouridine1911/1915/1917 synthase
VTAVRTVVVEHDGVRLDVFLGRQLPVVSRRVLRRVIGEGAVQVNGRRAAKGVRLRAGDVVSLPELGGAIVPEPEPVLTVVYEDDDLVAVHKPGGMPSHAVDPRQRRTAGAFLLARYPETATVGDPLAPGLVHRLDTGTSGILLAARNALAHAAMRARLRAHVVEKRYLAVVVGDARGLAGVEVAVALAHDPRDRRRMVQARPGLRAWPAATRLAVRRSGGARSLIEATIHTGVTHQVRVHLAHLGHPVVNDALYGAPAADLPAGRHALHAAAIVLRHPCTDAPLRIDAPLPEDLAGLLVPAPGA